MSKEFKSFRIISFCKWAYEQHKLPLPKLAETLKNMGFDGVDLPCRPGGLITHANGPEKLPEAKKVFEDHGLVLERLVTSLIEVNAETEKLLETIGRLGIKKIRIAGYGMPSGCDARKQLDEARRKFTALARVLEKHGVSGGIQNHSGDNNLSVNISSILRMIDALDPKWIGIQYDPGHCTISGEPLNTAIGLMGEYLHSVNIKSPRQEYYFDSKAKRLAFNTIWVPVKDGMLNLPLLIKSLKNAGYHDALSLHAEYSSHYHQVENDLEATNRLVAMDVAYIKEVMKEAW